MTIKEKLLMERLPLNGYNISKTAKEIGYAKSTARAGTFYRQLRKNTQIDKYNRPEQEIRAEFIKELDKNIYRFKKEKDNNNFMRATELKSKILALQIERHQQLPSDFKLSDSQKSEYERLRSTTPHTN